MLSTQLEWNETEEYYHFFNNVWDVRKAKQILKDNPREIQQISLEGVKNTVKRPERDGSFNIFHNFDWTKIDEGDVDLDFPIILAYAKTGDLWIIDGWHRVAKAVDQGIETLPGLILTKKESKSIQQG